MFIPCLPSSQQTKCHLSFVIILSISAPQVLITIYWLGRAANSCTSYNGPTLDLKEFEGLLSQMRKVFKVIFQWKIIFSVFYYINILFISVWEIVLLTSMARNETQTVSALSLDQESVRECFWTSWCQEIFEKWSQRDDSIIHLRSRHDLYKLDSRGNPAVAVQKDGIMLELV